LVRTKRSALEQEKSIARKVQSSVLVVALSAHTSLATNGYAAALDGNS
jgi:hypothetical protein